MLHASYSCSPIQGVIPISPSKIPLDCKVHHTPHVYMDIYGWLKAMTQFSHRYWASPVNNQILSFDVLNSHFSQSSLTQMQIKTSIPSYLRRVTPSMISPMTTVLTQNWRLYTTLWSLSGFWSMLTRGFNLTTWTLSWLKHGKTSQYHLTTSSWKYLIKLIYSPSALQTWKQIHRYV